VSVSQSDDKTYNQNYSKNELMEEKVGNNVREGFSHYNPCHVSVVKNTRTTASLHFQV
jgi:hypothetical protein